MQICTWMLASLNQCCGLRSSTAGLGAARASSGGSAWWPLLIRWAGRALPAADQLMDEIAPVSNSQCINLIFVGLVVGNSTSNFTFADIAVQSVQSTPNNATYFGVVAFYKQITVFSPKANSHHRSAAEASYCSDLRWLHGLAAPRAINAKAVDRPRSTVWPCRRGVDLQSKVRRQE